MNSNLSCRRLKRNELVEVRETQISDPSTGICKRVNLASLIPLSAFPLLLIASE